MERRIFCTAAVTSLLLAIWASGLMESASRSLRYMKRPTTGLEYLGRYEPVRPHVGGVRFVSLFSPPAPPEVAGFPGDVARICWLDNAVTPAAVRGRIEDPVEAVARLAAGEALVLEAWMDEQYQALLRKVLDQASETGLAIDLQAVADGLSVLKRRAP